MMKVSVIIPVYNEENRIENVLNAIFRAEDIDRLLQEVLIVDAGSTDKTCQIAAKFPVEIFSSEKGRAKQMNFGACTAKGSILHFVHADSIPPTSFLKNIEKEIASGYKVGCFRSKFTTKSFMLLICSYCTRFNGMLFRGGGQTLWINKQLYHDLRGYNEEMLFMEEYDFIQRVSKKTHFKVIDKSVLVSARDYEKYGHWRLQFLYGIVYVLYFSGASQKTIADFIKKRIKKKKYEKKV